MALVSVKADWRLKLIGLVQRLAAARHCVLNLSHEPGELSLWQCHDDSTINNCIGIIILFYTPGSKDHGG